MRLNEHKCDATLTFNCSVSLWIECGVLVGMRRS